MTVNDLFSDPSIALTTAETALPSFAYMMATLASIRSETFAIAAPMPRGTAVNECHFLS
jgi:hypothetical protein